MDARCVRCGRETERVGHKFDGLCTSCDYCSRYGHVDSNDCSRCGWPAYTTPEISGSILKTGGL